MFWKKLVTSTVCAISLLGIGWASKPQVPARVIVDQCQVKWKDERTISSPIPGIIKKLHVREGSKVALDADIAQLDDRETKYQYVIQVELANSETAIKSAELRLQEYITRKVIADDLFKEQAETQENRRLAGVQVGITELEKQTEVEKKRIEELKENQLDFSLEQHRIMSPMKGIVRKLFKREGESVTTGEDAKLAEIVDTSVVWVEAPVPVKYLYRVKEGQTAAVKLSRKWFYGISGEAPQNVPQLDQVFSGRVVFIDPNIVQNQRGTFFVRIEVQNTAGILRSGSMAEVEIDLAPPPVQIGGTR